MQLKDRLDFNEAPSREDTNAEKYALRKKLFGSDDVLPMWVADMDIQTPSFVMDAISNRVNHPILGYEEIPDSFFESQIQWIKERHGYELQKEWMFYSPSVVASINLCIQAFTDVGDSVITQSPVYFPFYSSITNNDRHLIKNKLIENDGHYSMDFDALQEQIDDKTKLLLLCSPHNPVGRVWKKEELQRLGEICEKYDILILADEIHSDLIFKGSKHIPMASISKALEARTITCYGPGKTFNMAGLAVSTISIADEALRTKFTKVYKATHFAEGTVFGHVGFIAAYTKGATWLENLLIHLQGNIDYLDICLKEYMPSITMNKPEGTYLVWLDCRGLGLSYQGLKDFFFKEAKLGLSTGVSFGREGEGFMRINLGVPRSTVEEAVSRLHAAYVSRHF
ncbi:PatB family C-S lyase [Sulfurimonas sp. MAG313]|nr:PatB family C-S lyase [Sulfurimonas sp. MAG313]MDF1881707.1 PatB family C-S lyase [Sulfurimonas sp. MAG313]